MSDSRTDYEARFRRAGLPLFIADRKAATDIWTRALPILGLVFWMELLGALNLTWPWWQNLLALLAGLAILAGAWALSNRLRGRRAFELPRDVGNFELAGFVIVPALLPLVLNGQPRSAAVTAFGNLLLLALLYVVIGLGLFSVVSWASRRLFSQLAASLNLIARAIPLLMIFSVVLYMTTEMWQVFADMSEATLAATTALFVALGTLFLVVRLPREVESLEADVGAEPPLQRPQRWNVGLILFVSQALQVLFIALAVGAFYIAFGLLVIDTQVATAWTGHAPDYLVNDDVLGLHVMLSSQELRVAGAISALSGLYYSIAVLTDNTYREEFLTDVTDDLAATFRARGEYMALVRAGATS
ncbi:MAG: hypothetical protein ACRDKI_01610 [Solirubrobacterales bacterium]